MVSGPAEAGGRPGLSIVIPAYNEAARLPGSLEKLVATFTDAPPPGPYEIVVVDDGSSDGTAAAAREAGTRLGLPLRVLCLSPNQGKGAAVRAGVLDATGDWVLVSDADFSTPLSEWTKLAAAGKPVAIGSRAVDRSLVKTPQPLFRVLSGMLFNRFVKLLAVPGIHDTQCGFKLFRRDAAQAVFSRAVENRFAFDVEALALARHLGFEIAEVPVLWFNSPDSRVSLLAGLSAFGELFRIGRRLRRLRKGV